MRGAAGGGDDVEQDLVALLGEPAHGAVEGGALQHEEAAHRIGQLAALQHQAREPGRHQADATAPLVPIADPALGGIARADHDIGLVPAQDLQHRRELPLVVLQVGVHHRDEGREVAWMPSTTAEASPRRPSRRTLRTRRSLRQACSSAETVPSVESSSTNTTSQRMPSSAWSSFCQQRHDVVALVEGGHDDRKQGPAPKRVARRGRLQGLCRQHGGMSPQACDSRAKMPPSRQHGGAAGCAVPGYAGVAGLTARSRPLSCPR